MATAAGRCATTGRKTEDHERETAFVAGQKLTEGADDIYVRRALQRAEQAMQGTH